jgi:hypothetical protein
MLSSDLSALGLSCWTPPSWVTFQTLETHWSLGVFHWWLYEYSCFCQRNAKFLLCMTLPMKGGC